MRPRMKSSQGNSEFMYVGDPKVLFSFSVLHYIQTHLLAFLINPKVDILRKQFWVGWRVYNMKSQLRYDLFLVSRANQCLLSGFWYYTVSCEGKSKYYKMMAYGSNWDALNIISRLTKAKFQTIVELPCCCFL